MDKITHEVRLAQWKKVVEECSARPEGQSARQWLAEHNIPSKTYYYWQRRVRQEAYDGMHPPAPALAAQPTAPVTFAEIPFVAGAAQATPEQFKPAAVIRSGGMTVAVSNSASDALLGILLKEVRRA